jgi:hypothetical protein
MAGLWTPPAVADRLREETAQREGQAQEGLKDEAWAWVEDFNRDLEQIIPGMRLKWCPDPAPVDAVAMGARPGRWGILIPGINGGPASVNPIVGPDGCFVDPSLNASAIFESLRAMDWWNPQVKRDRERAKDELRKATEKRKQDERDQMTEDIVETYLAKTRAFVSMNRDTPWSQNAAGRKGVKREPEAADRPDVHTSTSPRVTGRCSSARRTATWKASTSPAASAPTSS